MARSSFVFTLPDTEVAQVEQMLARGKYPVRSLYRAQVLLQLHLGKTPTQVANLVPISEATVYNLRKRYLAEGLASALSEKPRPGQPSKFDKAAQAHLTALACSEAPEGRSRWTLRLLADRLVELRLVDSISHKTVGEQLKKINSSPGSNSSGALLR